MNKYQQDIQNFNDKSEVLIKNSGIETHVALTSSEIAFLWTTYTSESLMHHVSVHFKYILEDPEIKKANSIWLDMLKDTLHLLESVFNKEGLPIPRGITSEDVIPNAARLFSDNFYVVYAKAFAKYALQLYSLAYSECSRNDMRYFFKDYVDRLVLVNQQATDLMLAKGTPARPPQVPTQDHVDFVKNKNFLTGFFGNKRPLSLLEISRLFYSAQHLAIEKALFMGFSQGTKSKEIQQYFVRGKELASKYFNDLSQKLISEDITSPPSFDEEVTASTDSIFSDRLMLLHSVLMSVGLYQFISIAVSVSLRRDLMVLYGQIMAELTAFAEEGVKLMIKNELFEQPPLAIDRDALLRHVGTIREHKFH